MHCGLLTPTDRQKGGGSNKREKSQPWSEGQIPSKEKALFSLRRLFGLFDPTVCPLCGSPERTTESTISIPLHTPLSSITSQEWNEIENAGFQSASEGDCVVTGKQGSTHRKHTWGISKDPLSTRTSRSRCLPNKLLFLQNPGNTGLPGAR